MLKYNFFCVICGEQFTASRSDARTCDLICRVTLSKLNKNTANIETEEVTDEQKEEVEEKIKDVKGETSILKKLKLRASPRKKSPGPLPDEED